MTSLPLVTFVTPSYNQGRFIRATIESILSQDYPNIEYIVMDGGSTDETAAVVGEYQSRLTWISERDKGQSDAINKGFRMAHGEILAWLNSDDVILPGAVSHAVKALTANPRAGAVYGEGYQMDSAGTVMRRFPATVPFNLWKLIYLSDYILQQSTYFRREALEQVGYVNEDLNWGMDWDLLIRIGKRFPIIYIPEYMGSIREYPEAKSFAGGGKRFAELAEIMRRHGSLRYPPGYITYGLDTYGSIWCDWISRHTPRLLSAPSRLFQRVLYAATRHIIDYELRTAQGLYADGWAAPTLKYSLRAGSGTVRITGAVPRLPALRGQKLAIMWNAREIASLSVSEGDFDIRVQVPDNNAEAQLFTIRASRSFVPGLRSRTRDFRRLSYLLKTFDWT